MATERVKDRAKTIGPHFLGHRFDPYPFSLLTLVVSLEAILLTGFVLISQDRMTKLADRRAHLDLQVNLLAEQELTAILKVVCLIADQTGVELAGCLLATPDWCVRWPLPGRIGSPSK